MSRTDKTDPHAVKLAQYPPGSNVYWRPEFGCGRSCKHCWGWWAKAEDRQARRQGKRQAKDWQREYV